MGEIFIHLSILIIYYYLLSCFSTTWLPFKITLVKGDEGKISNNIRKNFDKDCIATYKIIKYNNTNQHL